MWCPVCHLWRTNRLASAAAYIYLPRYLPFFQSKSKSPVTHPDPILRPGSQAAAARNNLPSSHLLPTTCIPTGSPLPGSGAPGADARVEAVVAGEHGEHGEQQRRVPDRAGRGPAVAESPGGAAARSPVGGSPATDTLSLMAAIFPLSKSAPVGLITSLWIQIQVSLLLHLGRSTSWPLTCPVTPSVEKILSRGRPRVRTSVVRLLRHQERMTVVFDRVDGLDRRHAGPDQLEVVSLISALDLKAQCGSQLAEFLSPRPFPEDVEQKHTSRDPVFPETYSQLQVALRSNSMCRNAEVNTKTPRATCTRAW